jgi:hypothetical protein
MTADRIDERVQAGERHAGLGLDPEHLEDPGVRGLTGRVPQQGALADAGLSGQDQGAGPPAPSALEQVVECAALGVTPVQHGLHSKGGRLGSGTQIGEVADATPSSGRLR